MVAESNKEEKVPDKTGKKVTRYVILREHGQDRYAKVGETDAASSRSALQQVVSKLSEPDGSYVAVPERSFQLTPVTVKQREPQLVIGNETEPVAPVVSSPVAAAVSA